MNIKYERINFEFPYPIQHIVDFNFTCGYGKHPRLHLIGMVLEQDRDTILEKANSETAITLRDNKGKLLFHGYATNIQFRLEGGLHYLHLEAEGASSKLDIAKRSRTFFKQGITYKEIIKTVLQSYPGAGIDAHVKLDRKADFPIIQYQETDWEFEISTNNSWAMNLEQPQMAGRHRRTFTYGLSADSRGKQLYDALTPRDALAFDLYDVKRIFIEDKVYDSKARQALKNYIDSYTNEEKVGSPRSKKKKSSITFKEIFDKYSKYLKLRTLKCAYAP